MEGDIGRHAIVGREDGGVVGSILEDNGARGSKTCRDDHILGRHGQRIAAVCVFGN